MSTRRILLSLATASIVAGCGSAPRVAPSVAQAGASAQARIRVPIAHPLPPTDGSHLVTTVVEVTYPPGASSPPHTHGCPVIGYVIAGALRSRVGSGTDTVYRAGETFYEDAGGAHVVSANASGRDTARFLAVFTCDRAAKLSAPLDSARGAR